MTISAFSFGSTRSELLELQVAYGQMVQDRVANGYSPFLLTFKFRQLPFERQAAMVEVMLRDVEHVYQRLLNRFTRHPYRPCERDRCSILIAAPDLPVPKHDNSSQPEHTTNDGLHVHGIFLQPPNSRFKGSFLSWLEQNEEKVISGTWLCNLHVVAITGTPEKATVYVMKTVGKRLPLDGVLVLPRAVGDRPRPTDAGYDEACRSARGSSLMRTAWKPF